MHSIRSHFLTVTNVKPHERFFRHNYKPVFGTWLSIWSLTSGKALIKKDVSQSKDDAFAKEVDVIESKLHSCALSGRKVRYPYVG